MSRGFGRDVGAYYAALNAADQARKGGDQQRADIQARLGFSERTTRNLLSQMEGEGLIKLDGRKPVSFMLSRHAIEFLFPALW